MLLHPGIRRADGSITISSLMHMLLFDWNDLGDEADDDLLAAGALAADHLAHSLVRELDRVRERALLREHLRKR